MTIVTVVSHRYRSSRGFMISRATTQSRTQMNSVQKGGGKNETERTKTRKARAIALGAFLGEKHRRDLSFSIFDANEAESLVSASATLPGRYKRRHGKKSGGKFSAISSTPLLAPRLYTAFHRYLSVRSLTHATDSPSPRAFRFIAMYLRGNN